MEFERGHLFHIYNQGNNRQKLFFNHENYLFFLRKVRIHILPYTDIIAWCLMPNHFHFMVLVRDTTVGVASSDADGSRKQLASNDTDGNCRQRSLNDSIGIMLRSYTNAINKQENRSGKLFREKTKAECLTCQDCITPSFYNTKSGTQIHIEHPEFQYPQICFDYIHDNPMVAGLVKKVTDWEFSSAMDYAGLRDGKLINKLVANEYVEF
ncbi:MAG: hypothetical protein K9H64_05875 [Bacteroidales bacterium]|nr:hypothetical protein [Bacteroidales bacterium]MCF8455437.1 hypothetical protein [Bacteroidales bacterium]